MVPYPPYVAFYLSKSPSDASLWVLLIAAVATVYAMYLFVLATYPNYDQVSEKTGTDNSFFKFIVLFACIFVCVSFVIAIASRQA